jgi:disulfide bond formation protein DsbB
MLFFLFKRAAKYLAILMLFFQLLQTATAFYHVGVERNIFEPTEKCLSDHSLDNLNFEELSAKLMEKRLPSCADAVYLLPYLSMAAANFLFALFLLILTLFLFRKNEIIRR